MHKKCAEDTSKKLSTHGKKLVNQKLTLQDQTTLIEKLDSQINDMSFEMKSLKSKKAFLEDDNQTKFEEIKLLKDYVYGMDQKAKEVHKHKFMIK